MKLKLKKLREQVVVITGASSGIGHATARMAARKGARVLLAARSEQPIRELAEQINSAGGQARYVVVDVSKEDDMRRLAGEAVGHFGHFDTWVNNAGVSIYGEIQNVQISDARRLFETNFWGMVYGSRIACEHLRHSGGALINVGSVASDRAIPLQGFYSASKHAVKGFTDSLRMEVDKAGWPIAVTLVKPTSIDTPLRQHAENLMDEEPSFPPPVYHPDLVAEAILKAAEKPMRDVFVGGAAKMMANMESISPAMADTYMRATMFDQQKSGRPAERRGSNLRHGMAEGEEQGGYEGMVRTHSLYHESAVMHPVVAGALGLGASIALGAFLRGRNKQTYS